MFKYTQPWYSFVLIENVKLNQQIPGWSDKNLVTAGETATREKKITACISQITAQQTIKKCRIYLFFTQFVLCADKIVTQLALCLSRYMDNILQLLICLKVLYFRFFLQIPSHF